jgi:hypothetical protein
MAAWLGCCRLGLASGACGEQRGGRGQCLGATNGAGVLDAVLIKNGWSIVGRGYNGHRAAVLGRGCRALNLGVPEGHHGVLHWDEAKGDKGRHARGATAKIMK